MNITEGMKMCDMFGYENSHLSLKLSKETQYDCFDKEDEEINLDWGIDKDRGLNESTFFVFVWPAMHQHSIAILNPHCFMSDKWEFSTEIDESHWAVTMRYTESRDELLVISGSTIPNFAPKEDEEFIKLRNKGRAPKKYYTRLRRDL